MVLAVMDDTCASNGVRSNFVTWLSGEAACGNRTLALALRLVPFLTSVLLPRPL